MQLSSKPVSMDPEFVSEDKELLESLGHEVVDYQVSDTNVHGMTTSS